MIRKIAFALTMLLVMITLASAKGPNIPRQTEEVLAILLGASDFTIPQHSSCYGSYGQIGPPKLKNLLAIELSYFDRGKNTVTGRCQGTKVKSCSILIRHEYGEAGTAAKISFTASSDGGIDINTLTCVISP